jgi:hypothetical protein
MTFLVTTRVPAHRKHTKFRDLSVGPEQVESGGQAVPTAEFLSSPSATQLGMKSSVRGRALARSDQGKMNTLQAVTISTLISRAIWTLNPPVHRSHRFAGPPGPWTWSGNSSISLQAVQGRDPRALDIVNVRKQKELLCHSLR